MKGTARTQKTSMEVGSKGLRETENSLGFRLKMSGRRRLENAAEVKDWGRAEKNEFQTRETELR